MIAPVTREPRGRRNAAAHQSPRGRLLPAITAAAAIVGLTGCVPSPYEERQVLDLPAIMKSSTDYQRAILDDGLVTDAEYEQALLARRDCVQNAGAVPGDIYTKGNNELTFDYEITAPTPARLEEVQREADACMHEYFTEIGQVWAYQQLLSPAEREQMRPDVIACLSEAGHTSLGPDADIEAILELLLDDDEISGSEYDCVARFRGFFSTWDSSGERHGHVHPGE